MKKNLLTTIIAISALVPSLIFAQTDACTMVPVNLAYGATDAKTDASVTVLQSYLYAQGYLTVKPTGFFGTLTRAAVTKFQKDNGIEAAPYGYVGPITRSKVQALSCVAVTTTPIIPPTITPVATTTPVVQATTTVVATSGPMTIATNQTPVITSILSSTNIFGTINSGKTATIYGTGLSGGATITITNGSQGVQTLTVNNDSDAMLTFTVPSQNVLSTVSITVTNMRGTSNVYQTVVSPY